jgi:hypothetical protein
MPTFAAQPAQPEPAADWIFFLKVRWRNPGSQPWRANIPSADTSNRSRRRAGMSFHTLISVATMTTMTTTICCMRLVAR